jgi:hypothetical protein
MQSPSPHRVGSPKVRVQATGTVLNPGDPGYEEALARINARKAAQPPPHQDQAQAKEPAPLA